ncbi:hypothetical protein P8C59_009511 [Phyllachora maydis]|uniref:Uncharacterized protein n=1 Tax=Phyllachora maydis TaxID=1825666 RepID=A0AAD9IFD4_9PEZI|nr:hypothetical protein P8C59_009511 [Phyllachora maydis]
MGNTPSSLDGPGRRSAHKLSKPRSGRASLATFSATVTRVLDSEYHAIGAFKLGTLRVVNGPAGPASPESDWLKQNSWARQGQVSQQVAEEHKPTLADVPSRPDVSDDADERSENKGGPGEVPSSATWTLPNVASSASSIGSQVKKKPAMPSISQADHGQRPPSAGGYRSPSKPIYDPWSNPHEVASEHWDQFGRGPAPPHVPRQHYRNRSTGSNQGYQNAPWRVLHSYNTPAYRNAPIW